MGWIEKYRAGIEVSLSALTFIATVVGFIFTIYQVNRTEETLRASNTYQIQKDSRDLADTLYKDKSFQKALSDGFENSGDATLSLWKMMNFYVSAYRQSQFGGLSDHFVESLRIDFCGFASKKSVAKALERMVGGGQINEDQKEMMANWCEKEDA